MKRIKLNKKFIILLMIFLLYVFCCNIMHSTIEGAENKVKLTKEEKDEVEAICEESYGYSQEEKGKCIVKERKLKLKNKIAEQESQKFKDDVGDIGVSVPSGDDCPKITSFYNLFAKAYCISDKIRKGAQDV